MLKTCKWAKCAKSFEATRPNMVFCSPRCRSNDTARRMRQNNPASLRTATQRWRKSHRAVYLRMGKKSDLKRHYGITPEQKEARLASQGHKCAACGCSEPGGRGWATDHSHTTGVYRGELCMGCNTALGMVKESPEVLQGLIAYLKKWENTP